MEITRVDVHLLAAQDPYTQYSMFRLTEQTCGTLCAPRHTVPTKLTLHSDIDTLLA